jgi:Ca2+-binding EF-hand superfamily protein
MKYRNEGFLLLLVAVLVLIPGWSAAKDQNATIPGVPMAVSSKCQNNFRMLDKNHDGKLTKDEVKADKRFEKYADKLFEVKDLDKKGYLTEEDFCKKVSRRRSQGDKGCKDLFDRLDAQHRGYLIPADFAAGKTSAEVDEYFKGKDTDHDGKLSLKEFCGSEKILPPPTQ